MGAGAEGADRWILRKREREGEKFPATSGAAHYGRGSHQGGSRRLKQDPHLQNRELLEYVYKSPTC